MDRVHTRSDGLVEGYGAGTAVVRSAWLVGLAVLPLILLALSVSYFILLLESCPVALLVHFPLPLPFPFSVAVTLTVAVEGAAPVEPLGIHRPNKAAVYPLPSAH